MFASLEFAEVKKPETCTVARDLACYLFVDERIKRLIVECIFALRFQGVVVFSLWARTTTQESYSASSVPMRFHRLQCGYLGVSRSG